MTEVASGVDQSVADYAFSGVFGGIGSGVSRTIGPRLFGQTIQRKAPGLANALTPDDVLNPLARSWRADVARPFNPLISTPISSGLKILRDRLFPESGK